MNFFNKLNAVILSRLRKALWGNRLLILICIGIYTMGFAIGASVILIVGMPTKQAAVSFAENSTPKTKTVDILVNNFQVLVVIALGGILMGAPIVYLLLLNGYVSGIVFSGASGPLLHRSLLFFPHAIWEYLGYCLAGAGGLRIPANFIYYIIEKNDSVFKTNTFMNMMILVTLGAFFIFVGALVEGLVVGQLT